MDVLLVQDVPGVGKAGQTKKVNDGYARNFLLPRKLAVIATSGAVRQAEALKQAAVRREAETREEARQLGDMLSKIKLNFRMKAGEGSRLFGAITAADISEALQRDHDITIDRRKIELEHPIKDLGERSVPIKLHPDVTTPVTVIIDRESE